MLAVGVDGARHEGRLGAQRQRHRVERVVERAHRRGLGDLAGLRGGGVLALGEAVDPVVEEQDRHVHVAAQRVDQVVAADRQRVAVTGDDPHREVLAGRGDAGRDRRRAAVDRVHAVGVEVVGEPRRAADAGDEHDVLAAQAEVGQERLDGLEHGVVAAPGAPAHLLVGGEVLAGLRLVGRRHLLGAGAQAGERQVGGVPVWVGAVIRCAPSGWARPRRRGRLVPSAWPTSSPITWASSVALSGSPRTWL